MTADLDDPTDRRPAPSTATGSTDAAATGDPTGRGTPWETRLGLARLGRLGLDQPLGLYLQQVADIAADVLPDVDALSVTLVERGRPRSAAFTSPVAAQLDERQYADGFGPCLDAAASGGLVRGDATTADGVPAYPDFRRVAARLGVRDTVAVGLHVPDPVAGALALHSTTGDLGEGTVALARAFAVYAGVSVANAVSHAAAVRLAAQLQEALTSRAVIEQAKGVLMGRLGVDADTAFARLTTRSQESHRKLRDVALDVIARATAGSPA